MKTCVKVAMLGLLLASAGVFASDNTKGLDVGSQAGFEAQASAIHKDLADGTTYSELSDAQRVDVNAALERIGTALSSHGGIAALPEAARLRVFNDQELVNTILTKGREDSRMMCDRETPIGSHRPHVICKTVAERRRDRERSQDALRGAQSPVYLDPTH